MTHLIHGLPAAPGIGIGRLFIYRSWHMATLVPSRHATEPQAEWQAFMAAQEAVTAELTALITDETSLIAEVFTAQQVILHDPTFVQAMQEAIFQERKPLLLATQSVINHLADLFRNLGDEYFASRATDVVDIGQRLLKQMGAPSQEAQDTHAIAPGTILLARDITFSELTQLPFSHIVGIALAESTPTAHSAILARSLGIPMVSTLGETLLQLAPQQLAVIDGHEGWLLVEPTAAELLAYQTERQVQVAHQASAAVHAHQPAVTQDGRLLPVLANANNPEDVVQACAQGADGIGLLRTEYLFQNRIDPPTLEEQVDTYRYFAQQIGCRQLTVRALDIGGDKPMPYLIHNHEANPFLGLRGARLLLAKPDLLATQYRALWLVAHHLAAAAGEVVAAAPRLELRFMLPMIRTVEEVRTIRTRLAAIENEATATAGTSPFARPQIKIGVMIEVPAAALLADRIAPLVDFLSVGTNDLAQYTLAADRTNSSVAALADPLHPAVLQLIGMTCQAAAATGIPVSICGEMGGDPAVVPLLVGLGLTELSVPVPAVPLVKAAIRRTTQAACRALAQQALDCDDSKAVRALLVDN